MKHFGTVVLFVVVTFCVLDGYFTLTDPQYVREKSEHHGSSRR